MRVITDIVIHCSATPRGKVFRAKDIRRMHMDPKKKGGPWADIGYHFVIGIDGLLEHGRALDTPGAHVAGHNANSIGICMIGGLDETGKKAEDTFSLAQYATLIKLVRELRKTFPRARISGHRDFSKDLNRDGKITPNEWMKQCPSFDVRAWCVAHALEHTPKVSA